MPPKFAVCQNVGPLKAGDDFFWAGKEDEDCVASHCSPPLEKAQYPVPHGQSVAARVLPDAHPGEYEYVCACHNIHVQANPKIIIQ